MKPINHPEPDKTYFCIATPAPMYKSEVIEAKKIIDFLDPVTGKQYQAQLEDMFWYPENLLSECICKMAFNKTAAEVRADVFRKYNLRTGQEIAIIQYKKL